jgi:predicted CoA-binding protein
MKTTLVIGASMNEDRYSYKAINMLKAHHHDVVAIGNKEGILNGVEISKEHKKYEDIDTITLYINKDIQKNYYEYILSLKPKRVIFNPGTENPELLKQLALNGIEGIEACTLVLLSTNQY